MADHPLQLSDGVNTAVNANEIVLSRRYAGDVNDRFQITADGATRVGGGAAAPTLDHSDWAEALDAGGLVVPHRTFFAVTNSTVTQSNQQMRFTYFRAPRNETLATVESLQGGTAAGATPTLIQYGLYSVDASGNLTLVASTPNDTTLMAGASGSAVTKSFSVPVAVTRGIRYAGSWLVVTGATAPTLFGNDKAGDGATVRAWFGREPKVASSLAAQATLPASVAVGSLAAATINVLALFT